MPVFEAKNPPTAQICQYYAALTSLSVPPDAHAVTRPLRGQWGLRRATRPGGGTNHIPRSCTLRLEYRCWGPVGTIASLYVQPSTVSHDRVQGYDIASCSVRPQLHIRERRAVFDAPVVLSLRPLTFVLSVGQAPLPFELQSICAPVSLLPFSSPQSLYRPGRHLSKSETVSCLPSNDLRSPSYRLILLIVVDTVTSAAEQIFSSDSTSCSSFLRDHS